MFFCTAYCTNLKYFQTDFTPLSYNHVKDVMKTMTIVVDVVCVFMRMMCSFFESWSFMDGIA